jgi:hypothetical protein
VLYVCKKSNKHLHENTAIYLASYPCTFSLGCSGIMVMSAISREKLGIGPIDQKRFDELAKPGHILAVPLKRTDADSFKKGKAIWIGNHERGKRNVYFRCLMCFEINAFGPHVPSNIAIDGTVVMCEICKKCQTHQFIQFEGWADYLSEDLIEKKRRNS